MLLGKHALIGIQEILQLLYSLLVVEIMAQCFQESGKEGFGCHRSTLTGSGSTSVGEGRIHHKAEELDHIGHIELALCRGGISRILHGLGDVGDTAHGLSGIGSQKPFVVGTVRTQKADVIDQIVPAVFVPCSPCACVFEFREIRQPRVQTGNMEKCMVSVSRGLMGSA